MNVFAWVEGQLVVVHESDEDYGIPEELQDQPVQTLTEGRSRLSGVGGTAYGIRRAVDQEMIRVLGPFGAIRYGEQFLQVGRDAVRKIVDKTQWWSFVVGEVKKLPHDEAVRLLSRLYNADHVTVRAGLPALEEASGYPAEAIRSTFIQYSKRGKGWKINRPKRNDWPLFAERMTDGEAHFTKATFPEVPPELKEAAREIEDGQEEGIYDAT